jgi:hypothetical protein
VESQTENESKCKNAYAILNNSAVNVNISAAIHSNFSIIHKKQSRWHENAKKLSKISLNRKNMHTMSKFTAIR